jgi:hypothetical protein
MQDELNSLQQEAHELEAIVKVRTACIASVYSFVADAYGYMDLLFLLALLLDD